MVGGIGDINSGLAGVSHTTGSEYQAMPSKSAIRPSVNNKAVNDVHISKALAVDDSQNKLMQFIRGERLASYTPQDNRELRTEFLAHAAERLQGVEAQLDDQAKKDLQGAISLLEQDANLDLAATMARNILIPA